MKQQQRQKICIAVAVNKRIISGRNMGHIWTHKLLVEEKRREGERETELEEEEKGENKGKIFQ